MAKTAARKPKPVVFVFRLGEHTRAGKKSAPSAYTTVPCYVYRDSEKARTKHLDAIEEGEVDVAQSETVFAAIEVMLDRCDLHRELSTDAEIDDGRSPAYTTGFHPDASFDEACAALARGGFAVCRVIDPLAVPPVKLSKEEALSRALDDLARHLDHASIADVLACSRKNGDLAFHAASAELAVEQAFEAGASPAFAAGVHALLGDLAPDARTTLLVLAARVTRNAEGKAADAARAFLATLPAPADAEVKRLLAGWKLVAGTAGPAPHSKPNAASKPHAKRPLE